MTDFHTTERNDDTHAVDDATVDDGVTSTDAAAADGEYAAAAGGKYVDDADGEYVDDADGAEFDDDGFPVLDPSAEASAAAEIDPATLGLGGLGDTPEGFRSGFVSFVGRPNTGKSTLTNALVGEKIAITANQPETTRHPIRGLVHRENAQVVVVDTPGLHRPRTLLGERLNEMVKEAYADVDVIGICVPADEKIGPGDRWIIENVRMVSPRTKLVGIVTKTDKVGKDAVGAQLLALHEALGGADVVPCSARRGFQVEELLDVIIGLLPEGPKYYPDHHTTDEDRDTRMAELIREAALGGLRDELPHSVAVHIDEVLPSEDWPNVMNVHAVIYVERPGQKKIVMRRMGQIITRARAGIIDLLGQNVYLDLRIKVLPNWQSDPKSLNRLGF